MESDILARRYIERLIQYEPLIGMASLIIAMDVPVVSMHSIMELMNGQSVTNEGDRESMRKFVQDSIDKKNVVRYLGMDWYSNIEGTMPGKSVGIIHKDIKIGLCVEVDTTCFRCRLRHIQFH